MTTLREGRKFRTYDYLGRILQYLDKAGSRRRQQVTYHDQEAMVARQKNN